MASNLSHREQSERLQQQTQLLRQETERQTQLADLQDAIAHNQERYDTLRGELSRVKIRIRENVAAYENLQHGDGSAKQVFDAYEAKVTEGGTATNATTTGYIPHTNVPAPVSTNAHPRPVQVTPEQLKLARQRYGNIITDTDGKTYAISCHVCGANTPAQQRPAHFENQFMDLDGMRRHYSHKHGVVGKERDEILAMCVKDLITPDDFDRIVRGQQPLNVKIRVKQGKAAAATGKQNRGRLPTQSPIESGILASTALEKSKKRRGSPLPPESRPSVIGQSMKELSSDGVVVGGFKAVNDGW